MAMSTFGMSGLWPKRYSMSQIQLHSFVAHSDSVNSVSWCPHSATQFASGSSDRRIILWDLSKLSENSQ